MTEEETYWVGLASIEGIGPTTFYKILAAFTEISCACQNFEEIPQKVKISKKVKENLLKCASENYRDKILNKLNKNKIKVVTRLSSDYPHLLSEIDNPPPVLYFKGQMPKNIQKFCAIVGSRKPSRNGYKNARIIAADLAAQGVIIVSGLARGIDSASHHGALDANGCTVAVMGCGLNIIYPPENKELCDRICENGAVISEYPPDVPPQATNFPLRNRIISGMSDAIIVGEGGEKSGARITVDFALKQGKTIYVIPCDPKSSIAALPNFLLDNGALVLKSYRTVMINECWDISSESQNAVNELSLAAEQLLIYQVLKREALTADEISDETEIPIKELNLILTYMEMRDIIIPAEGDKFQLK